MIHTIHEHFKDVRLDLDSHIYYVGDTPVPISSTGIVKKFKPDTDFDAIAKTVAKRKGITVREVRNEWEELMIEGCEKGSDSHDYSEFRDTKELMADTVSKKAIDQYYNDLPPHLEVAYKELVIYSKEFNFGGMIDLLLFNHNTHAYQIGDWKTNKNLEVGFGMLLEPFHFMTASNFNSYQIQLNLYKMVLEEYNIPVSGMELIWINDNLGTYVSKPCSTFTKTLRKCLTEKL